jgi:hypothetical protein
MKELVPSLEGDVDIPLATRETTDTSLGLPPRCPQQCTYGPVVALCMKAH